MKYSVGKIVVLVSGVTVYITGYDSENKKYKGINTEEENPENEILFSENEVLMMV